MELPSRDQVVYWAMQLYDLTFRVVVILAIFTILYILWNLIPRKEY